MKKIAIIGACCSRDLYNSKFVPNWKEYADIVYYSFQTSFISIMATPIPYSRLMIDSHGMGYSDWYRDILTRELEKTFCNDLISLSPDNIVIDFYSDVVNGVWEVADGKSYLSRRLSDDQKNNTVFKSINNKKALTLLDDYDKYIALWKNGIENFIHFLEDYLPNTRLIINYPSFSNQILMPNGVIQEYGNKYVDRYNAFYAEMVDYVKILREDIYIANLKKTYYIDPNYIFGGTWIVHYQKEYYFDLIRLIDSLCIDNGLIHNDNNINLLINSNGDMGTQYFKYFDDTFYIVKEGNDNHFEFLLDRKNSSYQQAWSHDIAVDASSKYSIRFRCRVSSDCPFSSRAVLLIRTYEKQNKVLRPDSIEQYAVKWDGAYDSFTDYSITISPKGKYLSVGLYCDTSGHISWKDISIIRSDRNKDIKDNYIVSHLIKDRKLVDINRMTLYL